MHWKERVRYWVIGAMMLSCLAVVSPAKALTMGDVKDVDISGYADVYSAWNLNNPNPPSMLFHLFENGDGSMTALNRMELVLDHPRWRLDLGYGPTDGVTNGGTGASTVNAQQLYTKWPVELMGRTVNVDFGKFVTHMGFEVIESKDNWLYTRGLLFQFAIPYWHSGIRATTNLNDKWTGHIAAVNGWNVLTSSHRTPSWCLQLMGKVHPQFTVIVNGITGADSVGGTTLNTANRAVLGSAGAAGSSRASVIDLVAVWDVNDRWSLGLNYDRGNTAAPGVLNGAYDGFALYSKWVFPEDTPLSGSALKARFESVNDNDLVLFGTTVPTATTGLTATTFTLGHDIPVQEETWLRLEYRLDSSNQSIFPTSTGTSQTQNSITLGLSTSF